MGAVQVEGSFAVAPVSHQLQLVQVCRQLAPRALVTPAGRGQVQLRRLQDVLVRPATEAEQSTEFAQCWQMTLRCRPGEPVARHPVILLDHLPDQVAIAQVELGYSVALFLSLIHI